MNAVPQKSKSMPAMRRANPELSLERQSLAPDLYLNVVFIIRHSRIEPT